MKVFTINYAIEGMLTFLPLFREVEADTVEGAKEKFNKEKSEKEYFCAITDERNKLDQLDLASQITKKNLNR